MIPIPYDFDVTGIVDAHYAVPPEQLGVRRITTRLYRGYCMHNETLPDARAQFLALKGDIMELVRAETRLDGRDREEAMDYLAEFYEVLESDEDFEELIVSECR